MKVIFAIFLLKTIYADVDINMIANKIDYSVSWKTNFTHSPTGACVIHSASEPFRLNDIKHSPVVEMLSSGFPSREYDIPRFSALTNPDFPLLFTNWRAQSEWAFSTQEMSDFEKVFDPKIIDLGAKIQFHKYSSKFFLQNPQQNFNLKIISIKTDSPWVTFLSHDINQIIRPDRRVSYEFQYLPTIVGEHQCYIYFLVEIQTAKNDIANHQKSKKVTSKTLSLKIKAMVQVIVENEYKLKAIIVNKIPLNSMSIQNIELYNSQKNALIIEEISLVQKQAYIRIPRQGEEDQDKVKTSDLKHSLNSYEPNVKEKYLLELPPNSQRIVGEIILDGSKGNLNRDQLNVKIGKNSELFVPVVWSVEKGGVNFVQDHVNLGVISSMNNFEHEFIASVENKDKYKFELVDIVVQITPEYKCFEVVESLNRSKNKSVIIGVSGNQVDIIRLRVFGSESNEAGSYSGKIMLKMKNLNNGQNETAEMSFSFSEYFQPVIYSPIDVSVYVNVGELNTAFGMHSEVPQKVNKYSERGHEILEIDREVHLKNNMTSNLFITNIYSLQEEISIRSIKVLIINNINKLQEIIMSRKQSLFTLQFKKKTKLLENYFLQAYIAIEVDSQFIIPLQVTVFDKSLQCITEDHHKVFTPNLIFKGRCSLKGPHQHIDFGNIAINEQRTKRFYIHNWNPLPIDIAIQQIESDDNQIKIALENIINTRNNTEKRNVAKQGTKRKIGIKLEPKTIAVIMIFMNAERQESATKAFTVTTTQEKINITVSYNVLIGSLSFSPGQLRFDQCFPGLQKNLFITARSTYNVKFKVNHIVSSDKRFIVTIIKNTIDPNERAQIAEVRFDASQDNFNYLNASIYNWNSFLSYQDLIQWRIIQEQWNSLVEKSKTDVKSTISLFTEIVSHIQIFASVILVTPQLLKEQSIDFGLQGINSKQTRQITLHNPSDDPVKVQLFLGPANLGNQQMIDKMLNDFSSQNVEEIQLCISDLQEPKIQQFFDSIQYIFIDKNSFVQFEIRPSNSNLDEFEYFNYSTAQQEQKSTNFIKQLVNPEAQLLLSKFYHVRCKQGKVPLKIKNFLDYNQFQAIISDPENFHFFDDWHIQFRRFLDEFIEIKDISMMTRATHQIVTNFSPTPSFLDKIQHVFKFTSYQAKRLIDSADQQQFYLTPEVRDKLHILQPHDNITLNTLIYQPGGQNATLIIKNNLTVLQMVPLLGKGGIAKLVQKSNFTQNTIQVFQTYTNSKIQENELLDNKIRLIRTFQLLNVGNLTISPNYIKIGNNECSSKFIYLNDCRPFVLQSTETKEFTLTIDTVIHTNIILLVYFKSP